MPERNVLTADQKQIRDEFVDMYGLDAEQISFEGKEKTPIFDYEAINALSLKLTDLQNIECEISERDFVDEIVTVRCTVTLPDKRERTCEDSAKVGEPFADGKTIDSMRLAEVVAQARAVRRGIRSVGINLVRAHDLFKRTGKGIAGHTDNDPRYPQYQEIKTIAHKIGLIEKHEGGVIERQEYDKVIAENFDGRTSLKDLDDLELQKCVNLFRTLNRLGNQSDDTIQKAA